MRIKYLTKKEIIDIHNKVLEGTNEDKTVLSEGNLEFCVEAPASKIFGFEPYKDIIAKVCCLLCKIIKLHPFLAGNKRTAYQAATIMLLNNGHVLSVSRRQAVAISYGLGGCYICCRQTTKWLRKHIRRARER